MNEISVCINRLRNLGIDLDSEGEKVAADLVREVADDIDYIQDALINARANASKDYGMTLRKFAAFCGVSPSFIIKWTDLGPQTEPDIVCRR